MASQLPGRPELDLDQSTESCWFPFASSGRPALYYLHDVSGSVLQAAHLARELAGQVDLVGFQAFGLSWDRPPDLTVEDMARRYLAVLQAQDPVGPYHLIGYSMGALVAFEMAAQAQRQAAVSVNRVVMIDPPPPASIAAPGQVAVVTALARSLGLFEFEAPDSDNVEDLLGELVRQGVAAELLPPDYSVEDLRPAVAVRWANAQAAARYRPGRPITGPISIISARAERLPSQVEGWAPHTDQPIEGQLVDSDHFAIVAPAHAAAVAAAIRGWLAET